MIGVILLFFYHTLKPRLDLLTTLFRGIFKYCRQGRFRGIGVIALVQEVQRMSCGCSYFKTRLMACPRSTLHNTSKQVFSI